MNKLWEKIKAIGINLPKLSEIKATGIKFSSLITIDKSVHIEGSTVVINPEALTPKQRHELSQIVRTDALAESGAILDDSTTPTVDEALEVLPGIEETAQKFIAIIPSPDVPLLWACLFLRAKYNSGASVEDLKGQIVRIYGVRGRNFCNLCSAGYLELWFWPLYEELLRASDNDSSKARARFRKVYNLIIVDLPWSEFVSSHTRKDTLLAHIRDKMRRNLQSGVGYLHIHALGEANVRKIVRLLPTIEAVTGAFASRIENERTRIFVRLEVTDDSKLLKEGSESF